MQELECSTSNAHVSAFTAGEFFSHSYILPHISSHHAVTQQDGWQALSPSTCSSTGFTIACLDPAEDYT